MKRRKPDPAEPRVMLEVFRGCIATGMIPHPASRCAEILHRLIAEARRREAAMHYRNRRRGRTQGRKRQPPQV